jgi:hypothetical protein
MFERWLSVPTAEVNTVATWVEMLAVSRLGTVSWEEELKRIWERSEFPHQSEAILGLAFANARRPYRVVRQPNNKSYFVSEEPDVVTRYEGTSNSIPYFNWYLAHNFLPFGKEITMAKTQDQIIAFTTKRAETYVVDKELFYQALTPSSPESDFIDLNDEKKTRLEAKDVVMRMKREATLKRNVIVMQTCVKGTNQTTYQEDPSWGRKFLVASLRS